jgi:TonB-linked SusC/RagA family outer membrane protein
MLPFGIFAQELAVKGTVIDETGEPLIGASIIEIEKPANGSIANVDGVFTINVTSSTSKIRISYVGYNPVELDVKPEMGTIAMDPSSITLQQVKIVGAYGKTKVINQVGAISQMSNKDLKRSPAANIQNALAGAVPGLFQQQTSGQPGKDAASISIRARTAFNEASLRPLILIDDIETSYSTLAALDVNEIETLSVLKDASTTAMYGIKGANGVILVTTKRGTDSAPKITYSGEYGLQMPTVYNKTLRSYDGLKVLQTHYSNDNVSLGSNPSSLDKRFPDLFGKTSSGRDYLDYYRTGEDPYHFPDVDWYNEVMRKAAPQTKHNIDIRGGTAMVKYFVNFGLLRQEGILKNFKNQDGFNSNYYYNRYNIRANVDVELIKDLTLTLSSGAILGETNQPYNVDPRASGGAWNFWRKMAGGVLLPWSFPVKNHDGSHGGTTRGYATINPVTMLTHSGYDRLFANNLSGNISLNYDLNRYVKGLRIKGTMALTSLWGYERRLRRGEFPDFTYLDFESLNLVRVKTGVDPLPALAVTTANTSPSRNITSQFVANYDREFGVHEVSIIGVANMTTSRSGANDPYNYRGVSGKLGYTYDKRYIAEVNFGYNGSDRFKGKKKYGLFPAVSLGWNISEEKFMKPLLQSVSIDYWKIRGSWGIGGSDYVPGGNYIYLEKYARSTADAQRYYFGENPITWQGIRPDQLGNDNVTWQKEEKINIGTDIYAFNNKLKASVDVFKQHRYDQLIDRASVPELTGLKMPKANLGIIDGKGYEIELNWRSKIGQVNYSLRGTYYKATTKVIEDDKVFATYPLTKTKGHPRGQIYGYIWDGFYQNEKEIAALPDARGTIYPGDLKYKDISGPDGVPDGKITLHDRTAIGKPYFPDVTYGFSLSLDYKGFDFSMMWQGAADAMLSSSGILQIGGVNGKPRKIHQDVWSPENRNPAMPRTAGPNFDVSTFWLRNASYLRLKNLELGYTFKGYSWMKSLGLNNLRLYTNAYNLITISALGLYDVDPESSSGSDVAAYSSYPQMKIVNFGLRAVF